MPNYKKQGNGKINITVKDGVDVNYQIYGDKKGSYFQGFMADRGFTVRVRDGKQGTWKIVLEDLDTGAQRMFQFNRELYIGRTPAKDSSQVKFVLSGDVSVSGSHCRLFEMSDRLVIEDLNSRNHTFLNGIMIQQPTEIPIWAQIRVGNSTFRVLQMTKE